MTGSEATGNSQAHSFVGPFRPAAIIVPGPPEATPEHASDADTQPSDRRRQRRSRHPHRRRGRRRVRPRGEAGQPHRRQHPGRAALGRADRREGRLPGGGRGRAPLGRTGPRRPGRGAAPGRGPVPGAGRRAGPGHVGRHGQAGLRGRGGGGQGGGRARLLRRTRLPPPGRHLPHRLRRGHIHRHRAPRHGGADHPLELPVHHPHPQAVGRAGRRQRRGVSSRPPTPASPGC